MSTAFKNVAVFHSPGEEEPKTGQRKRDNDGLHRPWYLAFQT